MSIAYSRSIVACVLVALFAFPPPVCAQTVATPDVWRAFTEKLETGKTLKVRLKNGQRFKATLLQVSEDAVTVQPQTRAAVPPQRVPFDLIETLEVDHGKGLGLGKAVAVGAAVAGGTFLALMALAFAVWGD
jgi:hypothetical protein